MVGEDAVSVYTQLLMKFIDLLVKIGEERRRGKQLRAPRKPKIRQGSLSKEDFNKLMKKGVDFRFIPIPKEKEQEIEKTIKGLGGSFFKADDPEKTNSLFAVPSHQLEMVQIAVKQVLTDVMNEHPGAVTVKEGVNRIPPEDISLVSDVMRGYDIPLFTFKGEDGMYTNIVPTEYNGQYDQAMNRVMEIKAQLENIDVRTFEMDGLLEMPRYVARVIPETEKDELYAAFKAKGLDVRFAHHGDDTAIIYPYWQKAKVETAIDEYRKAVDEISKFDITVNDNSISIDKDTLLKDEDQKEYFVRVPNTHGMDYLRLDKDNVTEINGGKTLTTKLDPKALYPVFDSKGDFVAQREGSELLKLYDVKHKGVNKDTKIAEYGNRVDKIELFNKEKNHLISVGIDNSERIREELMEQGVSAKTADALLAKIDAMLAEKDELSTYRSIFNYTVEIPHVEYADVPNIGDYLSQTQLSELVIGKADRVGELPPEDGKCCCFFDKDTKKYTIVSPDDRSEIISRLTQMGYSATLAEHLADKTVTGVDPQDIEEQPLRFDSPNAELENIRYTIGKDNTILIHDSGENIRYMSIDKDIPEREIESALFGGFGIHDRISAAVILQELAEKGVIKPLPVEEIGDLKVTKVSSDMIAVQNKNSITNESVIIPIDKLDHKQLKSMGADAKTIRFLEGSLQKSEEEFGKPDKLSNLRKFAENAIHNVGQAIGQVVSKADVSIHGDDR
ncbi:hypothetical protein [Ruminococcus sp.]|uniref:hypothetical protein n=1 Tax=Ruminococcus sp. TaxID=41978 RepID=UPI0025E35034|nr:hypothetical protein [Ruminococcus sp.]MBR1432279.1 hypothetical protein [Ruminococcus sp.]